MGGKQEKSGIGEGGRAATSVGCALIKLGKEVESMAAACTVLPPISQVLLDQFGLDWHKLI